MWFTTKRKDEKIMKKKIMGLGVLLIVVFACAGCGRKTFDLNDYMKYEVNGYEGYGEVSVSFDTDRLKDDIEKYVKEEREDEIVGRDAEYQFKRDMNDLYNLLHDEISVSADPNKNLKNDMDYKVTWKVGDKITDKIESICDVKISFDYSDESGTVSGLKPVKSYDAFENLDVSFDGMNGDGTVYITSESVKVPDLQYKADKESGLSNGDEVTITILTEDGDKDLSKSNYLPADGFMPKEQTKKFKVDGLSSYVTDPAQITGDALETLKQDGEGVLKSAVIDEWSHCKSVTVEYVGMYVLTSKNSSGTDSSDDDYESSDSSSDGLSEMFTIYKIKLKDENNKNYEFYRFVRYTDVKVATDNKVTYERYKEASSWDKEKDCIRCKNHRIGKVYEDGYESIHDLQLTEIEALADTYNFKTNIK